MKEKKNISYSAIASLQVPLQERIEETLKKAKNANQESIANNERNKLKAAIEKLDFSHEMAKAYAINYIPEENLRLINPDLNSNNLQDVLKEDSNKAFSELNSQYGYFNDSRAEDYFKVFAATKFYDFLEDNSPTPTAINAYKLMVLYNGNLNNIDKFFSTYTQGKENPVDNLLSFWTLPKCEGHTKENLNSWQKLFTGYKGSASHLLQAFEKSKILEKVPSYNNLSETLAKLKYPSAEKNTELAALLIEYNSTVNKFKDVLEFVETTTSATSTTVPLITHNCGNDYYILPLPKGDMRGLIMGNIVSNCQSIGGNGADCAKNFFTKENTAIYLLAKLKKGANPNQINWKNFEKDGHKIFGEGYVWESTNGNIVFDSWENTTTKGIHDEIIVKNLPLLAKKIIESTPSIETVTIGCDGKTPHELRKLTTFPSNVYNEEQYSDSKNQAVIATSESLKNVRELILNTFKNANENELIQIGYYLSDSKFTSDILKFNKEFNLFEVSQLLTFEEINTLFNILKKYDGDLTNLFKAYVENSDSEEKEPAQTDSISLYQSLRENATNLDVAPGDRKILSKVFNINTFIKRGYFAPEDLKDCNASIIEILTGDIIYEAFSLGATYEELIDNKPSKVVKKILKYFAINLCEEVDTDYINDIANALANKMVDKKIIDLFKSGKLKVSDFQGVTDDKLIWFLTSPAALAVYEYGGKVEDLKDSEPAVIKRNILKHLAIKVFGETNTDYIKNINGQVAYKMMDEKIVDLFKTGKLKVSDFQGVTMNMFEALTSSEVLAFYELGYASFDDLKSVKHGFTLKQLINNDSIKCLEQGLTFHGIKNLDSLSISLLTSSAALAVYEFGGKIEDLKDNDSYQIKKNILKQLATRICRQDDSELDYIDYLGGVALDDLLSPEAIRLYKTGKISPDFCLKDRNLKVSEKICSDEALKCYENEWVDINDMKAINNFSIILELTSKNAQDFYATIDRSDLLELREVLKTMTHEGLYKLFATRTLNFINENKIDSLQYAKLLQKNPEIIKLLRENPALIKDGLSAVECAKIEMEFNSTHSISSHSNAEAESYVTILPSDENPANIDLIGGDSCTIPIL